ncbi:alpha/beta fold hydrolase [Noviherbaspirillum denitrificans]|uniref:AB hydrolase-1 domain-containing protein n=1 Tax=Noviherbaspirillum denitrificans TaxID=1968433 RepID=A0A254TIJ9_9BURK|nr:alpha/beta hydrolase [Noviherbaspirillum denitrificans]OWW20383.1 hypothetical protein AYR66_13685 [Noviherbaspirillum denitrificans]
MIDAASLVGNAVSLARRDAEFAEASRGLPFNIELHIMDEAAPRMLRLLNAAESTTVQLAAEAATWCQFCQPQPAVGFHSFTAAVRDPDRLRVTGQAVHVAQALHALERFFEILRGQHENQRSPLPDIAHIAGRYAMLDGMPDAPVYFEHSGNPDGPALLMLHTAGADTRQYHHVLADSELRTAWSMYTFDMPGHGKSLPTDNGLWQGYKLTRRAYAETCIAFIHSVIRRPVVVMGCSMGAAMALYLGKAYPDDIAGIVALEAPYRATGRKTAFLAHPQVNQAAHNPSYVRGLMSPSSPLQHRRIAAWIYSQGGFQVYPGDLSFYSEEFDAEADLKGLDGATKPIHLLTGAYDYSASPADSQMVADLIPGARFHAMPELGHFPMIEHPDAFLRHVRPVMSDIRQRLPHHVTT